MTTSFQDRVYEVVQRIPRGRVMTYAAVARAVGCRSYRAIGQALKHNPYAPEVPCHRVIASNLTPGGFQGHRAGAALVRKLKLLKAEGVWFRDGRLAEPGRVWFG